MKDPLEKQQDAKEMQAELDAGRPAIAFLEAIYYRDCEIDYGLSPYCNYEWAHKNYDGAPDSTTRHHCGFADTIEQCLVQINDLHDNGEL